MNPTVPHDGITGPDGEPVLVRRSARRRRTVSATRRGGAIEIAIPASFSARQEAQWVRRMLARMERREATGTAGHGDAELAARARALADRHLEGRARPVSVTWSTRQNTRWGSCTPSEGTIRISHRLRGMPEEVLDYVLMHELAHLLESGHTRAFWALVERFPGTERARGFLDGVSFADQRGARPTPDDDGDAERDADEQPEPGAGDPPGGSDPGGRVD